MDVKVPNLGESISEGELAAWLVADGASVAAGQPVAELETDKASVEIVAESSGVLRHATPQGATVSIGEVIGRVEAGAGTSTAKAALPAAVDTRAAQAAPPTAMQQAPRAPRAAAPSAALATAAPAGDRPLGPAARRAAREAEALGTRPASPVPAATAPAPREPAGPRWPDAPGTRRERMSRLRRSLARRLVEAQHEAAILTTFNEIDMTEVMAMRSAEQTAFTQRHGVKLGYMSLFGRAALNALAAVPQLNAFVDGEDILHHDHVHLGIAVQTPRGLVVPVVRNADSCALGDLEKEIQRLAGLARDGALALPDLQGGTFTVSNGGIYGSLLSTPILNPPQSGILGLHAIKPRAVVLGDGTLAARPMMYVALSYDHRLVDGEQAVTFLVKVKEQIENPSTLLNG